MLVIVSSKTIPIKKLPSGHQKAQLLARVQDPRASINVVLASIDGFLNVYSGYPNFTALRRSCQTADMEYNCAQIHTTEQVARMGNKLSYAEAVKLFPTEAHRITKG